MPALKLSEVLNSSFLNGDGTISIRSDDDLLPLLWQSDQPFPEDVAHGQDKLLILDVKATPGPISIGDAGSLALKIRAEVPIDAELDIIWPDEDLALLDAYHLKDFSNPDTMYLVLRMDGEASVGADLQQQWKSFGLAASLEAGREIHYTYLRPFRIADHTAKEVLVEFFGNLRLPQNVHSLDRIPKLGEVLSLTYGGYLNVGVKASWGYSLNKSSDFKLGKLDLSSKIFIEAKAALGLSFGLAGNFTIDVRRARGGEGNWIAISVKKDRKRQFEIAADLNVKADVKTEMPDNPTEFLEGLLEIRTPDLVRNFRAYLDKTPEELIKEIKEKADGITQHVVDTLTNDILGKPLDALASSDEFKKIHEVLLEVKDIHDNLGAKVVGFIEDHLDDLDIPALIDKLEEATNNLTEAVGLEKITDSQVWRLLEVLVDVEWIDLIENTDKAFDKLKEKVDQLKDANLDRLKEFIDAQKKALNLQQMLDQLASLSPENLKSEVNKHLKELFNRLTDEIIDELSTSQIAELQKEINTLISKLEQFTKDLYDQFEQALNGSYELSIAYQYRHTKQDEALLEVEINLDAKASTNAAGVPLPSGAALAKQAVRGDFTEVLKFASPDRVLIRKGILTHKVTRAKELSINLFGWRASTTNQLITETKDFFEQKDNGVLHLYNTKITSISKRKRRGEETEVNLAFQVFSKGFQPTGSDQKNVLDAVTAMSSNYALRIKDPVTSRDELAKYLGFANHLLLIPDQYSKLTGGTFTSEAIEKAILDGYLDEIARELSAHETDGFGLVTVKYRLRYDGATLMKIFDPKSNVDFTRAARRALSMVATFAYADFPPFAGIAEAYAEDDMRKKWKQDGLKISLKGSFDYPLPSGKKITLSQIERINLDVMYGVEEDFIKSLLRVAALLAKVKQGIDVTLPELERVLEKFVSFQSKLDKRFNFKERSVIHPFLAVINRLSDKVATEERPWTTTLEIKLEIGDQSITKFLTS